MSKVQSVEELILRTSQMPLEKMRFFINEDRQEPRCFGIYQDPDSGFWVVYKNKADGSRAVRYNGPDEGYAANEIWQKIQSEIGQRRTTQKKASKRESIITAIIAAAFLAALIAFLIMLFRMPDRGYYAIDDGLYYYQDSDWYYYDDYGGDWIYYDDPGGYDWYGGHYYGDSYDGFDDPADAFEASSYYVEPSDDDDDDYGDSDLFDSWDSGDTDWDSDW